MFHDIFGRIWRNVFIKNPDIDGGTIDGATIATSNITVGAGKTLDVTAGIFKIETAVDATLSGTPIVGSVTTAAGTKYYFKLYPTKA